MAEHINISIVKSPDMVADIRIPKEMTVLELLGELKKIQMVPNENIFSIKELNRGIVMTDMDYFDQYQIADGDKIQFELEGK